MQEIRYTPRAKNKKLYIIVILLLCLSVAGFVAAGQLPAYRGGAQMAALICIVAGIFLLYKYYFSSYVYILTAADEEGHRPYFLVEQQVGHRTTLVSRLPLSRICEVRELTVGKGNAPRGRYFSYVATLGAKQYQVIRARGDDGRDVLVKIEADAAFLAAFRDRLAEMQAASAPVSDGEDDAVNDKEI